MFSRMLIRKKILCVAILLVGTLLPLVCSSLRGVFAYRNLTKSIGALSYEIQEMWRLGQEVAALQSNFRRPPESLFITPSTYTYINADYERRSLILSDVDRLSFIAQLKKFRSTLDAHMNRIHERIDSDPLLSASAEERELVADMQRRVDLIISTAYEFQTDVAPKAQKITKELANLGMDAEVLFGFMTERMRSFRADMRSRYHAWIAVIIGAAGVVLLIVGFSFWFFRRSVVQPFKILLNGSRRIARGDFDHRIFLHSKGELAELAEAQNKMTAAFVEIRDNLNEKVRQRTREVVRSEQLASVGFLAAGVAHEINNPLASIAWSAEALESRLHEILHSTDVDPSEEIHTSSSDEIDVLRKYLKRIQDEAFRCKGITERLLDFSRLGESQRKQQTDISESVSDVIALVKHLGQYRNRSVEYMGSPEIQAWVSPTEFKQVVLNLLTNSLDASDDGGVVKVSLEADDEQFSLTVTDSGCGMTEEVMTHLFEPFFTRRKDGRGTGLGLSITYRIVEDHGGSLSPSSAGPGQGSTFVLTMPLDLVDHKDHERFKAAA